MKISHKSYSKLLQVYDHKSIAKQISLNLGLNECEYIVTEKIHGSNFCFIVTINSEGVIQVDTASRTQLCSPNFFKANKLIAIIKEKLVDCFKVNSDLGVNDKTWYIYGELFGPGVNKGVYYGDTKKFLVFDIYTGSSWCDYDGLIEMINFINENSKKDYKLEPVPLIARGLTLKEALAVDANFNSLIVPVDKENICEGTVIKSNVTFERLVMKNKNPGFSEKSMRQKTKVEIEENLKPILEEILTLVNENRFNNVLSKYDKFESNEQIGFFIKEFNKDILEDFEMPEGIAKKDWKSVTKIVNKASSAIVLNHINNLRFKGE